MRQTTTMRLTLLPLLLGMLGACQASKLYDENRDALARADASLDAGELEQVVTTVDNLVAKTQSEADTYRLQRFFAVYLSSQAHLRAAFGQAFLPGPERTPQFRLGDGPEESGSMIAHLVATTREASYGLDWAPAKAGEKALAEQLPPDLSTLGVDNAVRSLSLNLLTVYARLGFDSKIARILDENPDMLVLTNCQRIMEQSRLPAESRPWVTYFVFRYLEDQDERAAFRFAASTLFPPGAHSIERKLAEQLEEWILEGSSLEYKCPKDGAPANPTVPFCTLDNETPLVDFVAQQRAD